MSLRPTARRTTRVSLPNPIVCRKRLGGLLKFYHRKAAARDTAEFFYNTRLPLVLLALSTSPLSTHPQAGNGNDHQA